MRKRRNNRNDNHTKKIVDVIVKETMIKDMEYQTHRRQRIAEDFRRPGFAYTQLCPDPEWR